MVVSFTTDKAGEQALILEYSDCKVSVPYTVMYQVDFVAAGEKLDTQYILNAEEAVAPTWAPERNGYQFAYWKMDLLY